MTKSSTKQPHASTSIELLPETINELSKFIDCMQLTHSDIIEEISDSAIIQKIGHELYDQVVRLRSEGKLE